MKRSTLAAAFALTAALTFPLVAQDDAKPAAPAAAAAAAPAGSKVIAKVDGVDITEAEAEERFLAMYGPRLEGAPPEQAAMMREHAMKSIKEELIAKTLLLGAADAAKIGVDEAKFAEMMEQVNASIPPDKTPADFYASMNMDEARFKKAIGEEVRINSLLDKQVASVAAPGDAETKKFYDENAEQFVKEESVSARHILIKTDDITDEAGLAAKKAELEAIRKQLVEKKGENFAELAMAHSGCPSSAKGGDLGTFGRGQMVGEFDKAAFEQKVGEIGPIIKTSFGYHVLQVTDKTEGGKISYDEIKDRIAEHLKGQQQGEIIQTYIASLREKANIEDLTPAAEEPGTAEEPPPAEEPAPAE